MESTQDSQVPINQSQVPITQSPTVESSQLLSSNNSAFAPKLSIKLTENNYRLWHKQVNGVLITHKVHRIVVNPQIPQKFNTDADRASNTVSDEYESWFVLDQAVFAWLLTTISESVLPRILSCNHAHEVWSTIHSHFHAVLKAKVRQLRSELKTTKKGTRSISEYILRIRTIADSLLAAGDPITEQDQIDSVLEGLPEEYSNFVMMIYSKSEKLLLHDIEALLYVQEAQLDRSAYKLN